MSQSADEDDSVLKDLVSRTLQNNGVLGKIQAQLRASVFLALEEEFKDREIHLSSDVSRSVLSTSTGRLAASLVHDFFTCLGFDFSLSVYGPESNLGAGLWKLHTHEDMLRQLNIQDKETDPSLPVLLTLCCESTGMKYSANNNSQRTQQAGITPVEQNKSSISGTIKENPTEERNTTSKPFSKEAHAERSRVSNDVKDTQSNQVPKTQSGNGTNSSVNTSKVTKDVGVHLDSDSISNKTDVNKELNRDNISIKNTQANKEDHAAATTVKTNLSGSTTGPQSTIKSPHSTPSSSSWTAASTAANSVVLPPEDILSAAAPSTGSTDSSSSTDLPPPSRGLIKHLVAQASHDKSESEDSSVNTLENAAEDQYSDDFSLSSSEASSSKSDAAATSSNKKDIPSRSNENNNPITLFNPPKQSTIAPSNPPKPSTRPMLPTPVSQPGRVVESKNVENPAATSINTKFTPHKPGPPEHDNCAEEQLETDDDISLDFLTSGSSSAREETEDFTISDTAAPAVDYDEKVL